MKGFLKDVLDGKVREVRKWLEKGENVSQYDEYGNTALHLAAEKGYRGVCKVLLDAGADVNQKNISVGWSAIHYAAYEGHSDVLRMLIAHGAVPDIPDKSGDTPESYAAEWENMECVAILREATAARRAAGRDMSEMYDSDERTASEDSDDDDDDESSMMNWIMPPPSVPKNVTNNINVSVNNSSDSSVHLSVHMQPPGGQQQQMNRSDNNGNIIENESLPDLTDQTLTGTLRDDDSDTYSEDTLQLMQQTNAMKSNKDGSVRGGGASSGMSIVDKIKNNLASQSSEVNSTNREKEI